MGARADNVAETRGLAASLRNFARDENGATAIEYTLIIALIFLVVIAAIRNYTDTTSEMYDHIDTTLQNG